MGRKCVVPNCTSGYDSNKEKVSLFKIPANKLEVWSKAIPRKDRELTNNDHVCAKHFNDGEIITEEITDLYTHKLLKPKLAEGAVPSKFPGCPKYLSKIIKNSGIIQKTQERPKRQKIDNLVDEIPTSNLEITGTKDVYVPSWFAFKSLNFLLEKDTHRKRKSPIPDDESEQQDWLQEESLGIDSENGRPQPSEPEKIDTAKICPPPLASSKKRKNNYTSIDDRLQKAFEILEQAAIEGDECQAFGMFVAKKLKSYTPYTRSTVQHSISNILFRADRECYGQSHSQRHHSDSPIPDSPIHSPNSIPHVFD